MAGGPVFVQELGDRRDDGARRGLAVPGPRRDSIPGGRLPRSMSNGVRPCAISWVNQPPPLSMTLDCGVIRFIPLDSRPARQGTSFQDAVPQPQQHCRAWLSLRDVIFTELGRNGDGAQAPPEKVGDAHRNTTQEPGKAATPD